MVNNNEFVYINNQEQLDFYVNELTNYNIWAVDTEFNRNNKNYLPQLCLIQISYKPNFALAIDCLAGLNLTNLLNLMYQQHIVKVFHACRQDIEMLYNITSKIPPNLFDTQIAVLALNLPKDISYDKLVKHYLNIAVDKSLKQSQWHVRPLMPKHIEYACLDVVYLFDCYLLINNQLNQQNRASWLAEAFAELYNPDLYNYNITVNATKLAHGLPKSMYTLILNIMLWREQTAKELDIARNILIDNKTIKSLVLQSKNNNNNLNLKNFVNPKAHHTLPTLSNILNTVENAEPIVTQRTPLTENQKDTLCLLKMLLVYCSNKHAIHSTLIASAEDLNELAVNLNPNHKVFLTWRYNVFGKYVQNLLNGKLGISMLNNTITVC